MAHELTLSDAHEYALGGRPIPGVTSILKDVLRGADWQASTWHLGKGTAAHAAVALVMQGRDAEYDFDPVIAGQVEAARRFKREVQPEVIAVECAVAHADLWYAGTVDLVAKIDGKLCIIDWKASHRSSVGYQLTAYALAWSHQDERGRFPGTGYEVVLSNSGAYNMTPYRLSGHICDWHAIRRVYEMRRALKCPVLTEQDTQEGEQ
jgi:hypothetical protein